MKITAIWALNSLLLFPIVCNAQARKRVAVLPFDDRGASAQIGGRISDELISKLAAMGTFEIVDQEHLNAVISEQNQGYGDRFSASGAAKLGKLVNADVLIFGKVESIDPHKKTETTGNFVSRKQVETGIVDLTVTARVIAVETGTIITAPSVSSEQTVVLSQRSSSPLATSLPITRSSPLAASLPIAGMAANNNGPAIQVYGNQWAAEPLDKAIGDVTTQLTQKVSSSIGSLQIAAPPSLPKFVGVENGLIVINKGSNAGIKAGDKFEIIRPTDIGLRDPDTNQPIISKRKLCIMTVTSVDDTFSSGTCDPSAVPQKGDEIALDR